MPKPSAERIFRSHFPDAIVEQETSGGLEKDVSFFVRRRRGDRSWSGRGDTKAQAWADACRRESITSQKEPA